MSSSRTVGSLDTWEPEDKSFSKRILREGQGETNPNDGSVCCVLINSVDKCEISEDDLGGYKLGAEVEVTIGEGDSIFSELFDKIVVSMKEGEACYVTTKINEKGQTVDSFDMKNSKLKFNVFLKNFSRAADLSELEADEKLERAEHHKEKGTEIYQANRVDFSFTRFTKALGCLESIDNKDMLSDSMSSRVKTLICQCHLNLAAGHLKKELFEKVIEHCTCALKLEPDNLKGLFRRGQALTKLNRFDDAKQDLMQALRIDKENKAVASQLRTVDGLIKKEKVMYQKMFSK